MVSGAARFELEGRWHVAPAGTSFLIPPGAVHTGESATPGGYSYRVLYLESEQLVERATLALPGIALEQGEALASVSRELHGLLGSGEDLCSRGVHPMADAARSFIHTHWREDFTLDELSKAVGYSAFSSCSQFPRRDGYAAICVQTGAQGSGGATSVEGGYAACSHGSRVRLLRPSPPEPPFQADHGGYTVGVHASMTVALTPLGRTRAHR